MTLKQVRTIKITRNVPSTLKTGPKEGDKMFKDVKPIDCLQSSDVRKERNFKGV